MEIERVLDRKYEIKKAGRKQKNVNPSPITMPITMRGSRDE
jgi:hypothetical protein